MLLITPPQNQDIDAEIWMAMNTAVSQINNDELDEFIHGIQEATMHNMIIVDQCSDEEILQAAIYDPNGENFRDLSADEIRKIITRNASTIMKWLKTYHFIDTNN